MDEFSKGLWQPMPPIEIDYAEMMERWEAMNPDEKMEAAFRYLENVYGGMVAHD